MYTKVLNLNTFLLFILVFTHISCNHQVFVNKISLSSVSNNELFNCNVNGDYPQVSGNKASLHLINNLIKQFVDDKLLDQKEDCASSFDEEILSTLTNLESDLDFSFQTALSKEKLSLVVSSIYKPLGAAIKKYDVFCLNYDFKNSKVNLISDFININTLFLKVFFEEIQSDFELNESDKIIIKNFLLTKPEKINFFIDNNTIEIYLNELDENLSFKLHGNCISILIDDIKQLLKVSKEKLPILSSL